MDREGEGGGEEEGLEEGMGVLMHNSDGFFFFFARVPFISLASRKRRDIEIRNVTFA